MVNAMGNKLQKFLAGAMCAQLSVIGLMQAASARTYEGYVDARNRVVAHEQAIANNRALAYNQAVSNANYNRALAYNRAASWNAYNQATALQSSCRL